MNEIIEKISLCEAFVKNKLENKFTPEWSLTPSWTKNAINTIYSGLINIYTKSELPISEEGIEILKESSKRVGRTTYDGKLIDIIMQVILSVRENSNGACIPNKVYISNEDYINIAKEFGVEDSLELTIKKTKIVPCDAVTKDIGLSFYCVSKPKFECVPLNMVIQIGVKNG
jgi:hypothetical protein